MLRESLKEILEHVTNIRKIKWTAEELQQLPFEKQHEPPAFIVAVLSLDEYAEFTSELNHDSAVH